MRSFVVALLAALAFPVLGCATGGTFAADGFHHTDYPYVVRYSDPGTREFLDANWRIDNYVVNYDGTIGALKTTEDYEGPTELDVTGSGNFSKVTLPYFDLKLDNRKTSAVIWLQTIPLNKGREERNLKNLAEDYASAISGSGFYAAVEDQGKVIREKTFAAKIVEGKETTLGGLEAYDAKIELANADQLRLDPAHAPRSFASSSCAPTTRTTSWATTSPYTRSSASATERVPATSTPGSPTSNDS